MPIILEFAGKGLNNTIIRSLHTFTENFRGMRKNCEKHENLAQ